MESGMGTRGHDIFGTESSRHVPGRIKACEACKARLCAAITIRQEDASELNPGGGHIGGAKLDIIKIVFQTQRVAGNITISKILGHAKYGKRNNLITGRESGQVFDKSLEIDLGVGRHISRATRVKDGLPLRREDQRKIERGDGIFEGNGRAWSSSHIRIDDVRKSSGQEIGLE